MDQATPKLLFRVWSDTSNGTNTLSCFKPASHLGSALINDSAVTPESINDGGERLRLALIWKKNTYQNPFIFFSSSLLFVLQLAARMKSDDHKNIYFTCVNTETATTTNGTPVKFYPVNDLMKKFGVTIQNRGDGAIREYHHEFTALSSVKANAGSRYISYDGLIENGLFNLYPNLKAVNERRNVKLHRAVTELRTLGFSTVKMLSKEQIDTAARLAMSFQRCSSFESSESSDESGTQLLAWFLSLRKRSKDDSALASWLRTHSHPCLNATAFTVETSVFGNDDPELAQHKDLIQLFQRKRLLATHAEATPHLIPSHYARDLAEWQAWSVKNRVRDRARRPERVEKPELPRHRRRNDRPRSSRRDGLRLGQGARGIQRLIKHDEIRRGNQRYRRRDRRY